MVSLFCLSVCLNVSQTVCYLFQIVEPGVLPALDEGMNNCDESSLGDLFLAPAYIQRQCHHHNNDFNNVMMVGLEQ